MNQEKLSLKSYDYLMNSTFERIKVGKFFNENFEAYSKDFINKIMKYFENREEYEKCQILVNFIEKRFNHEENFKKINK